MAKTNFEQILCTTDDTKSEQNETATSFYTAAVVELNAPGDKFTDSDDIVDANLAEYLALIQEASEQGVDILVFPEATLNYNGIANYFYLELESGTSSPFSHPGINIYENLTEVAVELQVEVPSALECDYSHDVVSLNSYLSSSYQRNHSQFTNRFSTNFRSRRPTQAFMFW